MKNERRETEGSEYVPAEISGLLNGMEEEPIYVMTVELEEGKSQAIKIYADSTPNELAFEFCKKNNLNITAMNYLTEQIKVLLDQLYNKLELVKRNTGLISEDEHQCIQEVDEENYQTEARKSGGNSLTPNSRFNYIEGTNENDSEKCNRKINKLKRQNEKIYNTKTEIKSDNIKPSVASEIKQKSFNEERTENKRDLTKNSNEEEKTNERFFNNKAISYELKTDKNSNIINPFNKYKELESPKRDSTNKKLIHDKNHELSRF